MHIPQTVHRDGFFPTYNYSDHKQIGVEVRSGKLLMFRVTIDAYDMVSIDVNWGYRWSDKRRSDIRCFAKISAKNSARRTQPKN